MEKKEILNQLQQKMQQRGSKELLSPQDQTKYDRLVKEINSIENALKEQSELTNANWKQILRDKAFLASLWQEKEAYLKEIKKANDKYYQSDYKLNWLRTLVRAGDLTQLQDLVRWGKI